MSKVTVYLEELLMHQLLVRLDQLPPLPGNLPKLPRQLAISPEFVRDYQQLAQGLIVQALRDTLGLRSFYQLEADQTRILRLSEPAFWQALHPRLSRAGIDWLWHSLSPDKAARLATPTAWDVLLLHLLYPRLNQQVGERWNLLWLQKQQADWQVMAWALLRLPAWPQGLAELQQLWQAARKLAYPVRFVLIAQTAEWLKPVLRHWQERLHIQQLGLSTYRQIQDVARQLSPELIQTALANWQSSWMLGYDDDLWIRREIGNTGLLTQLQALWQLAGSLGTLTERSET